MVRCLVFAGLCLAIMLAPSLGFSQEATEAESEYSYGTLVEVKKDSNEIVVSEYDWDTDKEVMVTYTVEPSAKVENIDSWKNIPNGSYLDIEYLTDKNGKRIANFISVYKPDTKTEKVVEEETAPAEPEEAEAE